MCVCVCIYVYIHAHIHIHTYIPWIRNCYNDSKMWIKSSIHKNTQFLHTTNTLQNGIINHLYTLKIHVHRKGVCI